MILMQKERFNAFFCVTLALRYYDYLSILRLFRALMRMSIFLLSVMNLLGFRSNEKHSRLKNSA